MEAPVILSSPYAPQVQHSFLKTEINEKNCLLTQIKQFCAVTLDNSTAIGNQKFGLGVLGFFGIVTIKNTQCSENETDGMVFSKSRNDPDLQNKSEALADEAQFIQDYGNCTDRSSKPSLIANNIGQRQEAAANMGSLEEVSGSSVSKRLFQEHTGMVYLLKCIVQQNRQDGIKSVDYTVQALGCTIQGNVASAIRLCKPKRGAECEIYIKNRKHETDFIGEILTGSNKKRCVPKIRVDKNLPQLLRDLSKVQIIKIYVELI